MYYKECYCIIINYLFKYPTQIWEGGYVIKRIYGGGVSIIILVLILTNSSEVV